MLSMRQAVQVPSPPLPLVAGSSSRGSSLPKTPCLACGLGMPASGQGPLTNPPGTRTGKSPRVLTCWGEHRSWRGSSECRECHAQGQFPREAPRTQPGSRLSQPWGRLPGDGQGPDVGAGAWRGPTGQGTGRRGVCRQRERQGRTQLRPRGKGVSGRGAQQQNIQETAWGVNR